MEKEKEIILSNFADDTKLGGVADTSEVYATVQQDLDRLVSLSERNVMRFNKNKYRVPHLGRKKHIYQYRLGDDLLERSCAEKDLCVLVDSSTVSSSGVPKTRRTWSCRRRSRGGPQQ